MSLEKTLNIPRLVLAGISSGCGKTTIAAGLMAALRKKGLSVQGFKVGPDYIDPSYHTLAAGRPSRNLDSWMLSHETVRELFLRGAAGADISIIEGVMGLFDGRSGAEDSGSTAEVAKILHAPVILVLDISKSSRSAAATALGCLHFDPELDIRGVIVNRAGSDRHRLWVKEAVEQKTKLPVLGSLPRKPELALPERHLGLVPAAEQKKLKEFLGTVAAQMETSFDIDALLRMARGAPPLPGCAHRTFPKSKTRAIPHANRVSAMNNENVRRGRPACLPAQAGTPAPPEVIFGAKVKIGVARDEAFSFYYQDNLELLEAWGAELVYFSPVHDAGLPSALRGIYLGGGFPEIYARQLSENESMRQAIRQAGRDGLAIYAECGGLMYLADGIVDLEGKKHPMVGLIPGWSSMLEKRLKLGYVTFKGVDDNPLLRDNITARGHEFHYSRLTSPASHFSLPTSVTPAWQILEPEPGPEGFRIHNIIASYIHLHFAAHPSLAPNFVAWCAGVVV